MSQKSAKLIEQRKRCVGWWLQQRLIRTYLKIGKRDAIGFPLSVTASTNGVISKESACGSQLMPVVNVASSRTSILR